MSGLHSSIIATSASTLSASTCAVVILVVVVFSSLVFKSAHFDLVRLAKQISVKTSLFWQNLWTATEPTPPQPIINALALIVSPHFLFLCNAISISLMIFAATAVETPDGSYWGLSSVTSQPTTWLWAQTFVTA